jgi:hypothetical protein
MQQPALQDSQKVLLVNKIIQGTSKNTNVLKSKLYLSCIVLKTFDKLDVHAQVELIKPKNKQVIGILDFIVQGVSLIPTNELNTQIWTKNSLNDQLLISFGIMLHGLYAYSMNSMIQSLLGNLVGKTTLKLQVFILEMFQILSEIGK